MTLERVYQEALAQYPELAESPPRLQITSGHGSIAEVVDETLRIEALLLDHPPLLHQELLGEEFHHLLLRRLLRQFEARAPTLEERALDELATDLRKIRAFQLLETPQEQAATALPLMTETDEADFYKLMFAALDRDQREAVMNKLAPAQFTGDARREWFERRRELLSLQPIASREDLITELVQHYRTSRPFDEEVNEYFDKPVDLIQRLRRHEEVFWERRIRSSGTAITLDPLQIVTSVSADITRPREEVIVLTHKLTGQKLRIERVAVDEHTYLKVGNRTYRVRPGDVPIDLDLLLTDPLSWVGNAELVAFYTQEKAVSLYGRDGISRLEPMPANQDLQPELTPPQVSAETLREARLSLYEREPELVQVAQTGEQTLTRAEQLAVLHHIAIVGGQAQAEMGKVLDPGADYDEAIRLLEFFLGRPEGRSRRLRPDIIRLANQLRDYLIMVHFGFDEHKEEEFVAELGSQDPGQRNLYYNQPPIPGKGRAIRITPLPPPDEVSHEPLESVDALADRSVVHIDSLQDFADNEGEAVEENRLLAIVLAGGAATRFGGRPQAP